MTQEAGKPPRAAEHFVRRLAVSHAQAFRDFGAALEQFGRGEIHAGGVVRTAGDLYYRQLGHVASELIGAVTDMWDWGLDRAGADGKKARKSAAPAPAPKTSRTAPAPKTQRAVGRKK